MHTKSVISLENLEKQLIKEKAFAIPLNIIEKEIFGKQIQVSIPLKITPCGEKLQKEAEKYLNEIEEWSKFTFKF
jgi:hypothetical protein